MCLIILFQHKSALEPFLLGGLFGCLSARQDREHTDPRGHLETKCWLSDFLATFWRAVARRQIFVYVSHFQWRAVTLTEIMYDLTQIEGGHGTRGPPGHSHTVSAADRLQAEETWLSSLVTSIEAAQDC